MPNQEEFLETLIEKLNRQDIPYMLSGVVQWNRLDPNYLRKWAKELKVESSLERLLEQAKKLLASR
jgi:hypothetical protein